MELRWLLGLDDFPPRWHCGNWSDPLGWIHILSNLATWAAYFTIPVVLLYFLKTRGRDLPFSYMLPVFGAFIMACGVGHLIDAIIFWCPIYRIAAVSKVLTALASWIAVFALFDLVPKLLGYPSPEALRIEVEKRRELQDLLEAQRRELLRSNEALDAFATSAGHDLKAPLRSIRNLANFVEEDNVDRIQSASIAHLHRIKSKAEDLERLVNDLLEYSRVDFNQDRAKSVNTHEMIEEILDLFDVRESFTVVYASEFPTLITDVVPLASVIRNLVDNAIKHHPSGRGVLEFGVAAETEFLHFWVKDDGAGIRESERKQVFRPLRRFSQVTGHGLGLSLVKRSVELAGGEIWLESAQGEGTTFHFTWPK